MKSRIWSIVLVVCGLLLGILVGWLSMPWLYKHCKPFYMIMGKYIGSAQAALKKPDVNEAHYSYDAYEEYRKKFPQADVRPLDANNYTGGAENSDWVKAVEFVCKTLPLYRPDRFDCENFAEACSALISMYFGWNAKAWCWGDSPLGYHGWFTYANADKSIHQVEPQTCKFDPDGYIPRTMIMT